MKIKYHSLTDEPRRICITGGSGFIGSNLIKIIKDISKDSNILNLDIRKPRIKIQQKFWQNCNLKNKKELLKYICDFKPNYVIHLAADTTMTGKNLKDYSTNIEGVDNLLYSIKNLPTNVSVIIASSQHVKKPGTFVYSDKKVYSPLGLYGKSKVITEDLVRNYNLKQNWFIIRPSLVWGPGNIVMADAIFKYINNNIYYHPKDDNTVRSYGYVDNVCNQILELCTLDSNLIDDRVFYLADHNILQKEWISLAVKLMGQGELKTIPKSLLETGSYFGEYLRKIYPKFPLYRERYLNLTTSNPIPLERTYAYLGIPQIGIYEGMVNTVKWLKDYYKK